MMLMHKLTVVRGIWFDSTKVWTFGLCVVRGVDGYGDD